MGSSMCENLMRAGFSATVYNRTRSKAETLLAAGARWAASPRAVAEQSDVIFTIVGYPADVREVVLGGDGALAGCRPGAILVDMTTSEPSLAVEIAREALQRGVTSLDAPVSGGDVGAREARLSIMIGGDARAVAALQPCWQAMGKTIVHQGGPGAGQQAKMVNQALIASCMVGVCESLLYGYKAGLDLEKVLQSVSGGGGLELVAGELRPADVARRFRARLLRRTLPQGPGHHPRRIEADEPHHARRRPGRTALPLPAGPGPRPRRHAIADPGLGRDDGRGVEVQRRVAYLRRSIRPAISRLAWPIFMACRLSCLALPLQSPSSNLALPSLK